MDQNLKNIILQATGANAITKQQKLQSLWSGYGEIVRITLQGATMDSVVLKRINYPNQYHHPAGWNSDRSDQRKRESYRVEMQWYQQWSKRCDSHCRIPYCYNASAHEEAEVIVLEDLDGAGFDLRKSRLSQDEVKLCLGWLAHFHATFMGETPTGLWHSGSYWHLATRPDELAALQYRPLKQAAIQLDQQLNNCQFKTVIHGDAKMENFCFSPTGDAVAAVDFQYVGGGCGMKDVVYLFDSCLSSDECERWGDELLAFYFSTLQQALNKRGKEVAWQTLKTEWSQLYPVAWADFYRFLLGWAPGSYSVSRYAQGMINQALSS